MGVGTCTLATESIVCHLFVNLCVLCCHSGELQSPHVIRDLLSPDCLESSRGFLFCIADCLHRSCSPNASLSITPMVRPCLSSPKVLSSNRPCLQTVSVFGFGWLLCPERCRHFCVHELNVSTGRVGKFMRFLCVPTELLAIWLLRFFCIFCCAVVCMQEQSSTCVPRRFCVLNRTSSYSASQFLLRAANLASLLIGNSSRHQGKPKTLPHAHSAVCLLSTYHAVHPMIPQAQTVHHSNSH